MVRMKAKQVKVLQTREAFESLPLRWDPTWSLISLMTTFLAATLMTFS